MEEFNKLLEIAESDLAWILWCSLCGLQTSLQEAKKKSATDPGISACEELLKKLEHLLESVPKKQEITNNNMSPEYNDDYPFEPIPHPDALPPPIFPNEPKLIYFNELFCNDTQLQKYLGTLQLQSTTDADLWNEIQRLLLRVPTNIADDWRHKLLQFADSVGAQKEERSLFLLPFSRDEVIYPSLMGEIQAQGLGLSKALLEQQPIQVSQNKDLFFLSGVVYFYQEFIKFDSSLHHALKSISSFAVTSLNPEQEKHKYIRALKDRFQRVLAAENQGDAIVALRARLDLDEALHSLVYSPQVDRYSWWGKLQEKSRQTLDRVIQRVRDQGNDVQFRPLWGPYASIRAFSSTTDLERDIGGIQGEVLSCLRVYVKINGEEIEGRVLFRSLQ